jgi:hypothetical protein
MGAIKAVKCLTISVISSCPVNICMVTIFILCVKLVSAEIIVLH